jgi:hypothetical protein
MPLSFGWGSMHLCFVFANPCANKDLPQNNNSPLGFCPKGLLFLLS